MEDGSATDVANSPVGVLCGESVYIYMLAGLVESLFWEERMKINYTRNKGMNTMMARPKVYLTSPGPSEIGHNSFISLKTA